MKRCRMPIKYSLIYYNYNYLGFVKYNYRPSKSLQLTMLGYAINSFCTFSKSPDLEASKSPDSKSKITGGSVIYKI